MMNYKLVATGSNVEIRQNKDASFVSETFNILETPTNQIVASDIPAYNNQAKSLCRHLNMGGGFDGFTPSFFLSKISPTGA